MGVFDVPWIGNPSNQRMSNGLQFIGSYTFSKTIDNATADVFSTVLAPRRPEDFRNLAADRSNSILDHRNRFTLALLYDVQAFKHSNWMMKNLVGNWTLAPHVHGSDWAVGYRSERDRLEPKR